MGPCEFYHLIACVSALRFTSDGSNETAQSIERESAMITRRRILAATATLGWRQLVVAVALLAAGVAGGWATSTTCASAANKAAAIRMTSMTDRDVKQKLVGSYAVTGTDPDGRGYRGTSIIDISMAPSGALELDWDNGRRVGIGQLMNNVLTVASTTKAGTVIMMMNVNPDGTLSGQWSRRRERGYEGTERWTKI